MKTNKIQRASQFITALTPFIVAAYSWSVDKSGQIVATAKHGRTNKTGTPLQAVANYHRRRQHLATTGSDFVASNILEMDVNTFSVVEKASAGSTNRGYPQVLRGRILKTVGLK